MTEEEILKAHREQMAYAAKATGAFRASASDPPKTGVRPKVPARPSAPPPQEAPTRPDVKKPMPDEKKPTNGAVAPIPVQPSPRMEALVEAAIEGAGGKLSLENVRALITQECEELKALLHEKNAAYGNSALDPVRLFSKASPVEQLLVRIDDKISRIARGDFSKVRDEDLKVVTKDLLGYLILIRVAWRLGLR